MPRPHQITRTTFGRSAQRGMCLHPSKAIDQYVRLGATTSWLAPAAALAAGVGQKRSDRSPAAARWHHDLVGGPPEPKTEGTAGRAAARTSRAVSSAQRR